ncbi:hypothetical protein EDC01DRAFT_775432 [Geopyxis carbonaria]|nr:hypothetical protein EDC01DRAFT_775432 [Geopyxis carbonaria]
MPETITQALLRLGTVHDPNTGDLKPLNRRVVQLRFGWEGPEAPSTLSREQRRRRVMRGWEAEVPGEGDEEEAVGGGQEEQGVVKGAEGKEEEGKERESKEEEEGDGWDECF